MICQEFSIKNLKKSLKNNIVIMSDSETIDFVYIALILF